jgi:hypothetical protein
MEGFTMQTNRMMPRLAALAVITMLGGCATWNHMDRQEKGTATGATGGAIVGAAVGGPIGAAVGAAAGGYAGHYETKPGGLASANPAYGPRANDHAGSTASPSMASESSPMVRDAQQALNDRGYSVGTVDGIYGPTTEQAVRDFQRAQGLDQTGQLDARTLAALNVPNNRSAASSRVNGNANATMGNGVHNP